MRLSATASEHRIESHKVPDYRLVYAFKNNKSSVCGTACTPCDLHRHYIRLSVQTGQARFSTETAYNPMIMDYMYFHTSIFRFIS